MIATGKRNELAIELEKCKNDPMYFAMKYLVLRKKK